MRKRISLPAIVALALASSIVAMPASATSSEPNIDYSDHLEVTAGSSKLEVAKEDEGTTFYSLPAKKLSARSASAAPLSEVEAYEVRSPFQLDSEMGPDEVTDWTKPEQWDSSEGTSETKEVTAKPLPTMKATVPQVSRIDTSDGSTIKWPESATGEKTVIVNGNIVGTSEGSEIEVDSELLDEESTVQAASIDESGQPVTYTLPSVEAAKASSKKATVSAVSHKTFIPYKWVHLKGFKGLGCSVNSGKLPKTDIYHAGNNRSYKLPTSLSTVTAEKNYKTAMLARVAWEGPNGGKNILTMKGVGATKMYDFKKKHLATRTASSKHMYFKDATKGSSLARITFEVEVGNPFCVTGAIKHRSNFILHRSGVIQASGQGRDVPNHELAGFAASGNKFKWGWLSKSKLNSFDCLISNRSCKPQNWNGKVTLP
ncbi:hypothetical protein [Brevibacterium sediminis]|uniref:Uncharacterized protein n=2 Tax=Brevibacterium sediminis TaxID=1857024 RepID=A0ABQ1LRF4_9MICO|nr:hypothetical protein [Brevibacterium sediminis]GGC28513.1 hypothetical protein GCM10010974_08750 [Brevibacterium sediminis]